MEKIIFILYLAFVSYINCSQAECQSEISQTECSSHDIEYEGFSCYKYKRLDSNTQGCQILPDNTKNQIIFYNIANGMNKEAFSGYFDPEEGYFTNDKKIVKLENVLSNKDEEAVIISRYLTDDEKNMIESKKSCSYNSFGRVIDNIKNNIYDFSNINDKNICFNSVNFPELENLVDCGYAEIKLVIPDLIHYIDREYNIKTCFFIPNDNLPKEIWIFLKKEYIDFLFLGNYISSMITKVESNKIVSASGDSGSGKRKLDWLYLYDSYELVVEDKNGKKIKYTSSSDNFELVSEGGSANNNASNWFKLNISFIISLIILLSI